MKFLERIFNNKKKIKIPKGVNKDEQKQMSEEYEASLDFYLKSHLSVINMSLRGMADKRSKELNSELIYHHLKEVSQDFFEMGYKMGLNDQAVDKLKNDISRS